MNYKRTHPHRPGSQHKRACKRCRPLSWEQVSDSPWNAGSPEEIKYDFDVLVVQGGQSGLRPSIFTFGGDRETFDFTDPTNYLNVDNDVWRFSLPGR